MEIKQWITKYGVYVIATDFSTYSSMRSTISRRKLKDTPKLPKDLEDINIIGEYKRKSYIYIYSI